jgi:hypothetical protein
VDGDVSNVATGSHAADTGTTRHILPSQLITAATLAFNRSSTSIPDLERDNNVPNSAPSRSSSFEADNLNILLSLLRLLVVQYQKQYIAIDSKRRMIPILDEEAMFVRLMCHMWETPMAHHQEQILISSYPLHSLWLCIIMRHIFTTDNRSITQHHKMLSMLMQQITHQHSGLILKDIITLRRYSNSCIQAIHSIMVL